MLLDMQEAPRCRARSKRSGQRCRAPALRDKAVCRMHGAAGGAPRGNKNALKHGRYTTEALASRRENAALIRAIRELEAKIVENA